MEPSGHLVLMGEEVVVYQNVMLRKN